MIPGTILIFAQRHWKAILAASTALFLSGGWYLADARADRWQAKAELIQSHFDTYKAEVKATVAEMFSNALKRVVDDANARNNITVEIADALRSDRDILAARYSRLRAQTRDRPGGALQASTVPGVPDSGCRFIEDADSPGFWAIPSGCALDILQAADENTGQLVRLQEWVSEQGSVTVPIPE